MNAPDVLCLNCGSSSLKFSLYAMQAAGESLRHEGSVEGIGLEGGRLEIFDGIEKAHAEVSDGSSDHGAALKRILDALHGRGCSTFAAAGHRVVHGGPDRSGPARIDSLLLDELRARVPTAPLHLPQELLVIDAMADRWPDLPQVACFDTAFHRRLPETAQRFPLPRQLFDDGVRRYGYHGLSYEFVVETLAEASRGRVIIAHLGHGSSLVALQDGRPVDTTMGFTPTGGVMMATRSGDLDPGVLLQLLRRPGWDRERIDRLVNREAGLLGVSGSSADMRRLLELRRSDARADQAVSMFCRSVRKAIGALASELGGLDLLVFTGGIGERAAPVRDEICRGLAYLGVRSSGAEAPAGPGRAGVGVRVIETQENRIIARRTWGLVFGPGAQGTSAALP